MRPGRWSPARAAPRASPTSCRATSSSASLDILALPGGESLLGLPQDLAPTYALSFGTAGHDGLFVTGSFTAAPFLAAELGVELLSGGRLAAQGTALRAGGGVPPAWQFRLPVHALLRPHETLAVQPRIGGRVLPGLPLTLSPGGLGFLGCLDAASPNHVEGWAVDLSAPGRRVRLDVVVGAEIGGHGHRRRAAPGHRRSRASARRNAASA